MAKGKGTGKKQVSDKDFIAAWQGSSSAREVASKLSLTETNVYVRARNLRKNSVPLKEFERANRTKNYADLSTYAESLVSGNGHAETEAAAPAGAAS